MYLETWQLYLMVSAVAASIILALIYPRVTRRPSVILPGARSTLLRSFSVWLLVGLAIVVVPTLLIWHFSGTGTSEAAEAEAVLSSFNERYNPHGIADGEKEYSIVRAIKTEAYIIIRTSVEGDTGQQHSILLGDDSWLELAPGTVVADSNG